MHEDSIDAESHAIAAIEPATGSEQAALMALVPEQLAELQAMVAAFESLPQKGAGRMEALTRIAGQFGLGISTLHTKFYRWKKDGLKGLVNKKRVAALWDAKNPALTEHDISQARTWMQKFQRNSAAGIRMMMQCWRTQSITPELAGRGLTVPTSDMPINPLTGYPRGWGSDGRNLLRYRLSEFEAKAARQGRTAASSHRPLVYKTRANLYVGQIREWDDMWHDFEVVEFDRMKRGRPLEFHGMDLASAYMFSWGFRVRVQREDGSHEGLRGADFRFLYAAAMSTIGYHPQGTEEVIEHGTTAIPESIERLLWDETKAITFRRGGMSGDPALTGQYYGRPKGNFRVKAALESHHNLIHNVTGFLPGQTGKDRQHAPEWMDRHGELVERATGKATRSFGLQKHADALLDAAQRMPEEVLQLIQFPLLNTAQAHYVLSQLYAQIAEHRHHALEGWDMKYLPDERGGMRKMSRAEAYHGGCRRLRPLAPHLVALMFSTDEKFMEQNAVERTVRNGMIELQDASISGDRIRYSAHGAPDLGKFLTVLNPFAPQSLYLYDARGGFVATLPRIEKPCASDTGAIHRRIGEAMKTEAAMLAEVRKRDLPEAMHRLAMHQNNARALAPKTRASSLPDAAALEEASAERPERPEDSADSLADELTDLL